MIGAIVAILAVVLLVTVLALAVLRWMLERSIARQHGALSEEDVARGLDYENRRHVERVGRKDA